MSAVVVSVDGKSLKSYLQGLGRQAPYVTRLAQTRIAQAVKTEAVARMDTAFDRPTPYTKNAFWVRAATKSNPVAEVYTREFAGKGVAAGKYLAPNVYGGQRRQKRSEVLVSGLAGQQVYMVPDLVPKDAYGNVNRGQIVRMLSALRAFQGDRAYMNMSAKTLRRLGKRKLLVGRGVAGKLGSGGARHVTTSNFFIGRTKRGGKPWAIYEMVASGLIVKRFQLTTKAPQYRVRYPFHMIAEATIARVGATVTAAAIREALLTDRRAHPVPVATGRAA